MNSPLFDILLFWKLKKKKKKQIITSDNFQSDLSERKTELLKFVEEIRKESIIARKYGIFPTRIYLTFLSMNGYPDDPKQL